MKSCVFSLLSSWALLPDFLLGFLSGVCRLPACFPLGSLSGHDGVRGTLKLERLQAFSVAGMRLGDELPVHTLTPQARVTTRFGREASSGRQLSQTLQMLDSTASSLRKQDDRGLDRPGRRRPDARSVPTMKIFEAEQKKR